MDVALCILVQRRWRVQIASLKVECMCTKLFNMMGEPMAIVADGEFDAGP